MSEKEPADRWFCKVGSAKLGPLSTGQLRDMLQRGALTNETSVWRDGMESWLPLSDVRGLADGVDALSDGVGTCGVPARRAERAWLLLCVALGLGFTGMVVRKLVSGRDSDPYSYRPVSGVVHYEDGKVIPTDVLTLTFVPLAPPHSPRIYPRPGFAVVDPKTGVFQAPTSRKPGDGLVEGGHKVLITGLNRLPIPEEIVPREYADFDATPLTVNTSEGRFELKVRRPLPTAARTDLESPKADQPR